MGKVTFFSKSLLYISGYPRPTNSGVSEGLGRGPFIKKKWREYYFTGILGGYPQYITISKNITTQTWSVNSGGYLSRSREVFPTVFQVGRLRRGT